MSFDPSAFLASRFGGPPAAAPASGDVLSRMVPITRYSESRGNPNAVSPKGARGTMQVMPSTAARPGYGIKPSNGTPDDDARVGSEKLAAMMSRYGNDPAKAWAAYNWGEDKLDKAIAAQGSNWLSVAPKETKDYVSNNLAMLSGKAPIPASGSSFDPTAFLGKRFQAQPAAQQQAAQGEPDVISAYMGDKEAAPAADTPYAKQFRTGLQAAFRAKGATPETVQAFLDPYGVKYADLKVGGNPFGNAATLVVPDKVVPQAVPEHTAADALSAGFKQGAQHDVGGTLDKFASWADSKVPALNAIDRLASGVNPALDPNAITARAGAYDNQRQAFDANYGDSGWASTGRFAGQLATSAPLLMAGGEAIPAALEGAGAFATGTEEAPEAVQAGANFLRGTAGRPVMTDGVMTSPGNKLVALASRSGTGAMQGADAAALSSGSSDESVGAQMRRGAMIGAPIGAASPLIGKVLSAVGRAAYAPVSPFINPILQAIPSYTENRASNLLAQRVLEDGQNGGPSVGDMLGQSVDGKPLTLMDLGGENTQAFSGRMNRTPGPARQTIGGFLTDRDAGAEQRLVDDVRGNVSDAGSSYDTSAALTKDRAQAAKPLYEAAWQVPPVRSPELDRILTTPAGKAALPKALEIAGNDGESPTALGFVLDHEGNVTLDPTITMNPDGSLSQSPARAPGYTTKALHYVKMALDDQIESARDSATGKLALTPRLRSIQGVKNGLLDEMDNVNPDYAAARAAYSGPSDSMDALRRGSDVMRFSPEENRDFMKNLSDGDKEFFRQGAADSLIRKLTTRGGDESKVFGKDSAGAYVKQQLRPLFDSDDHFDSFMQRIDAERRMFQTKQNVMGGSQTAQRAAEDGSGPDLASHAVGVVGHLLHGNVGSAAAGVINALQRAATPGLDRATQAAIANRLVQPIEASGPALRPYLNNSPALLSKYLAPAGVIGNENRLRLMSQPQAAH